MKEKIKKMMSWRPGSVWYLGIAVVLLLAALYPLIRLATYSVPWYDDYNYGGFARMAMRKGTTIWNALKGAWECSRISWYAWQGTYGSIMLMALVPTIWGDQYYWIGPVFLILILTFSVVTFIYVMCTTIFKADRVISLGIGTVGALMMLELLYTAQEGLYWYNGGVHYVGMHALFFVMIAVLIRMVWGESKRRYFLLLPSLFLAVLVAGSNFVTSLQGILVVVSVMTAGLLWQGRKGLVMIPVTAVYGVGYFFNVLAPGNDKRAESYVGWGMSAGKSVLFSFVEGGKYAWRFTGFMTLAVVLLLFPAIWYMVSHVKYSFKLPGLVSLWSVCLYATGFTPSLYSLGHGGLERTLTAAKLTWQALLILNLIWWCGWICRRRENKADSEKGKMCRWWYYLVGAVLVLAAFQVEPNKAGSFCSYGAWYYIHTGEAGLFYQEYQERVAMLKGDEVSVGLPPYHFKPWLICMGELSEDPKAEENRALADWYGKDEVFLIPEE